MPLFRRMPKRGFNNARHTTRYIGVNVGSLNDFKDGDTVDQAALRKVGLAAGRLSLVKILGDGEIERKLTVIANAFSVTAKAKIEAMGGKCELIAG